MLIRVFILAIVFILPSFLPTFVKASVVNDINVGRVTVDLAAADPENEAITMAMEQVFIKMSGNKRVSNNLTVQNALENAQSFLISSSTARKNDSIILEARFNQRSLEAILKSAGEPLWANLRPTAVLWLAKESKDGDVKWFSENTDADFHQTMLDVAFQRGLSVILPLGDLTDATGVTDFDVWTRNIGRLETHSERYDSPYIISATLSALTDNMREVKQEEYQFILQQGARSEASSQPSSASIEANQAINAQVPDETAHYQVEWIIKGQNHILTGQDFVMNEAQGIYVILNAYADMLAVKFASAPELEETEKLETIVLFENVKSLTDYSAITELLENMPQVASASLLQMRADLAYFNVMLMGSPTDFINVLQIDPRVKDTNRNNNRSVNNSNLLNPSHIDLRAFNQQKVDIHLTWQD